MTAPTPMPYVKFYTKVFASPRWRATPPNHRFVFMSLVVLAGANGTPGYVVGSDYAIAMTLGCTKGVVKRAVDRFTSDPNPSLARTESGVRIVNWGLYQAIPEDTRQDKTRQNKTTSLDDLPRDAEWWTKIGKKFPGIDLLEELDKAKDWPKLNTVQNHKNFFRNWLGKATPSNIFDLPNLDLEEARIG